MTTHNPEENGFWLRAKNGAPLSAFSYLPEHPRAAVLVCNAFAEERKGCLKPLVDLSRRLAANGIAVLRFDYSGCGDSAGTFGDGGLDAWRDDLAVAAQALAGIIPSGLPTIWLGVRAGAALALDVAASNKAVPAPSAIVLWEPVDGASFVKQLVQRNRINTMIAYGKAKMSLDEIESAWASGEAVDLDGYLFPSRLVSDLRKMGPVPVSCAGAVFKLGTDPKPSAAIKGACPHFEEQALRLPPFWNTVGQVDVSNLLDATEKWIISAVEKTGSVPVSPAQKMGPVPVLMDGLRQVAVDGPKGIIRGILHLPDGKNGAPLSGAFLFLHGWSGDKSGPHGMFTAAAARLAKSGNACLRIDFGGRGASDGLASEASIARMAEEARSAVRWLRSNPETAELPMTIIALCSGCKVAITLAANEPSIQRLVLWSAESMGGLRDSATGWRKTRAALLAYARKLCRLETWKKIVKRQVKADMVGKALTAHETRSPEEARAEDRTLKLFRGFKGKILFAYGGSDPDAPGSSKAYQRFCARNHIDATHIQIEHAGHSYYATDWKEELLTKTMGWIGK